MHTDHAQHGPDNSYMNIISYRVSTTHTNQSYISVSSFLFRRIPFFLYINCYTLLLTNMYYKEFKWYQKLSISFLYTFLHLLFRIKSQKVLTQLN